jgi:hypothetical protein
MYNMIFGINCMPYAASPKMVFTVFMLLTIHTNLSLIVFKWAGTGKWKPVPGMLLQQKQLSTKGQGISYNLYVRVITLVMPAQTPFTIKHLQPVSCIRHLVLYSYLVNRKRIPILDSSNTPFP